LKEEGYQAWFISLTQSSLLSGSGSVGVSFQLGGDIERPPIYRFYEVQKAAK